MLVGGKCKGKDSKTDLVSLRRNFNDGMLAQQCTHMDTQPHTLSGRPLSRFSTLQPLQIRSLRVSDSVVRKYLHCRYWVCRARDISLLWKQQRVKSTKPILQKHSWILWESHKNVQSKQIHSINASYAFWSCSSSIYIFHLIVFCLWIKYIVYLSVMCIS